MSMNISQSILRSLLVNKKVGTEVSSKKFEKLRIWKDELTPYLDKLQKMGYIDGFWKSVNVNFKILKPVTLQTINEL
jgi:hypothetical protein